MKKALALAALASLALTHEIHDDELHSRLRYFGGGLTKPSNQTNIIKTIIDKITHFHFDDNLAENELTVIRNWPKKPLPGTNLPTFDDDNFMTNKASGPAKNNGPKKNDGPKKMSTVKGRISMEDEDEDSDLAFLDKLTEEELVVLRHLGALMSNFDDDNFMTNQKCTPSKNKGPKKSGGQGKMSTIKGRISFEDESEDEDSDLAFLDDLVEDELTVIRNWPKKPLPGTHMPTFYDDNFMTNKASGPAKNNGPKKNDGPKKMSTVKGRISMEDEDEDYDLAFLNELIEDELTVIRNWPKKPLPGTHMPTFDDDNFMTNKASGAPKNNAPKKNDGPKKMSTVKGRISMEDEDNELVILGDLIREGFNEIRKRKHEKSNEKKLLRGDGHKEEVDNSLYLSIGAEIRPMNPRPRYVR